MRISCGNCGKREVHQGDFAFSLLEVMFAMALFFMALFAILGLVAQNLRAARSLNQKGPTAGIVAAEFSQTNKLFEGSESGDFGELHPEHSWIRDVTLVTNNLFHVDIAVLKKDQVETTMSFLLFRPESSQTSGRPGGSGGVEGGGGGRRGGGGNEGP